MKKFFAYVFGLKLVYVRFGYDDHLRVVRKTSDGREYVRVYGETCMLENSQRRIIRIN